MKLFGKQLDAVLRQTGILQKDLAAKIGCSNVTLSKWKKKQENIDALKLEEISKILGVSITYWYDDDVSPSTSATETIAGKNKEISLLKELLTEKERTIQILMGRQ